MNRTQRRPSALVQALEGRTLFALLTVAISDPVAITEGTGGNPRMMSFRVDLSAPAVANVTIGFRTNDGTAKAGSDFGGGTGNLVIPATQTTALINIPINPDAVLEGTEKFTVTIFNSSSAEIVRPTATGTITDDDQPLVTIAAADKAASEVGGNTGTFRVSRAGPLTKALKVFLTYAGTAKNGVDYAKLPAAVTIPIGKRFVDVRLTPILDAVDDEGTELATIKLKAGAGYQFADGAAATIKIADRETVAPTAKVYQASNILTARGTPYQFTLTYTDERKMDAASVGGGDIRVTGPNGYSELAVLVGKTVNATGTVVKATYRVPAPGGSWTSLDNGSYTMSVVGGQVQDASGNAVASGALRAFTVDVPA
jgi:hypothetical protein